jgi:diguanylate cyclase (GGDEF)-like protein
MATSYTLLGDPRRALRLIDAARADFATMHDASYEGMLQLRTGEARAALGEHTIALAHFERAARAFEAEGNDRYLAMLYPARARSFEALGQAGAALADYKRHIALQDRLRKTLGDQRTQLMRHQFDASRRELENRRLIAEKSLRDQQVDALLAARRWQRGALVIGGVLVLVLVALVVRQMRRSRRLGTLVLTDSLTGVANRRRLEVFGEEAIARARADGRPLSVLAFDIDHFKRVNDSHGHAVGDAVLVRVAQICQGTLRDFDLLGRTGGEEFVVVLPDTGIEAARQVAERLRAAVERLDFGDVAAGLRVTVSIGATPLQPADAALTALVRRADAALYRAKRTGRNRVETAHGERDLDPTPGPQAAPATSTSPVEPAAIPQM